MSHLSDLGCGVEGAPIGFVIPRTHDTQPAGLDKVSPTHRQLGRDVSHLDCAGRSELAQEKSRMEIGRLQVCFCSSCALGERVS